MNKFVTIIKFRDHLAAMLFKCIYNIRIVKITGYRWAFAPEFAFGFEVGYVDLGEYTPDFTGALPAGTSLRDAELNGWNLGVNAHWNLSDNWYLSGRTGLFSADVKGDYLDANLPVYLKRKN